MTDITRIELPTKRPYEPYARYAPEGWPKDKDYLEIAHVLDDDKWYARMESEGGSQATKAYDTEAEAEEQVMEYVNFRRAFWDEYLKAHINGDMTLPDPKSVRSVKDRGGRLCVRVDGHHYVVGHEPSKQELESNRQYGGLGHGGREFKIRMHDGREIVTRNLWGQGKIPLEYREVLPDNAVFIE
jgi:hypothetical protein